MILLGFLLCLCSVFFSFYKDKSFISPAFLLSMLWLVSYFLQFFRQDLNHNSIYYLVFAIGLIFFCFGFYLSVDVGYKRETSLRIDKDMTFTIKNNTLLSFAFYLILLLFLYYILSIYKLVLNNFKFNVWQSIVIAKSTGIYTESLFVEYGRIMIICFTLFYFFLWLNNKTSTSTYKLLSLYFISFTLVFTAGNRGTIFLLVISSVIIFILTKKKNNRFIIFILLIVFVSVISIFVVTTFFKFTYEDQSNKLAFMIPKLRLYFTTSMPAFVTWIKNGFDYSYGANTFNFFAKILNNLGANIEIPNVVQKFIYVNQDYTNVYTVYQYYVKDFGVLFAFLIQFILGNIYGKLFYKVFYTSTYNSRELLILSTLYFPLLNQFFDDKYFSITSTWIQIFFWFFIFEKFFVEMKRGLIQTNER